MSYKEETTMLLSGEGTKIPLFKVRLDSGVIKDLKEVIDSGFVGEGPKVREFEERIERYLGGHIVAVNSCTSALQLALRLCDVKHNDSVITTPMTCTATNMPILAQGASISWGDVDPTTGNLNPLDVKKELRFNTKAIMCVHWAGYPCDLDSFSDLERYTGVPVIQDAAHAFGGTFQGEYLSNWTRFTCFSFQAIKHLTCVDGGALVCRDKKDAGRARLLRWFGMDRNVGSSMRCKTPIPEFGYKFHMNDLNATIGLYGLEDVDKCLSKCKINGLIYTNELKGLKRVKLPDYLKDRSHSYWLFPLLVDDRDKFIKFMDDKGVAVSEAHTPNNIHPAFYKYSLRRGTSLPGLKDFSSRQVNIPVGWWIDEDKRNYIINMVKEFDNDA